MKLGRWYGSGWTQSEDRTLLQDVLEAFATGERNLLALRRNTYPGRIVIGGLDETSTHLVLVSAIMGRSATSRNRVYGQKAGRVYTDQFVHDPSADTSLIIYSAMAEGDRYFVASNGAQTDTVMEHNGLFAKALLAHSYERDAPNYTPRITAMCSLLTADPTVFLSRICKIEHADETVAPLHEFFCYRRAKGQLPSGMGWCLQTYQGDGSPLPTYRGKPYSLPLRGGMEPMADVLWAGLNKSNRVGLAVKFIEIATGRSSVTLRNTHDGD